MASSNQSGPQPTLLFIPDISGFTEFVNSTEILHSQHIIEELLEAIIDANELGLKVSEIEGDAILFFREGKAPTPAEMLSQVRNMYLNFHAHLRRFESYRICQCGACCNARHLQLKFFLHYGDIAKKQVKQFNKLFGRDVIVAHRLMKNDIEINEYALFTTELLNSGAEPAEFAEISWDAVNTGEVKYDVGDIHYSYLSLAPLSAFVPEPKAEDFAVDGADKRFDELQIDINAPLELVFDVISDMGFRHHWNPGIKDSTEVNHAITGEGTSHRCVIDNGPNDPFFRSHSFEVERNEVTWVESSENVGTNQITKIARVSPTTTRLTQTAFFKAGHIKMLVINLFFKKKILKQAREGLNGLKEYCETLAKEGKWHDSRVILYPEAAEA